MFFLNIIQYGNVLKGQGIFNMRKNDKVKTETGKMKAHEEKKRPNSR